MTRRMEAVVVTTYGGDDLRFAGQVMIDDDSSLGGGFGRIGCWSTMFGCKWRLFGQVIRFNMRFYDVLALVLQFDLSNLNTFSIVCIILNF
ncbi:hypothetical protein Hanom_Chr07g00641331 [Helianthus anomalus]